MARLPDAVIRLASVMSDSDLRHKLLESVFPRCALIAGRSAWLRLVSEGAACLSPEAFADYLETRTNSMNLPPWLSDVARIEWARHRATSTEAFTADHRKSLRVNPTLQLVPCAWTGLPQLFSDGEESMDTDSVRPGRTTVGVWKASSRLVTEALPDEDLLVLKLVIEHIPRKDVAALGNVPVTAIDHAVNKAVRRSLLVTTGYGIRRSVDFPRGEKVPDRFFETTTFSLQWHLTQACDLNCKHCYDRTDRRTLPFSKACSVLEELRSFCTRRYVDGHISFTGGNPLLYPRFNDVYRTAAEYGFSVGILGNPAPRARIEELIRIARPRFYQVSLEGLHEHNDSIRGHGHFDRVVEFLEVLKDLGISSLVMLTLTRANLRELIPLAEFLQDKTDLFTFNRLSLVGEGARLALPEKEDFENLLREYHELAHPESAITLKDNLFNVVRLQQDLPLFGGCAGHGCSAAFNFLSLLPDGEVHACRKFPSLIGNIHESSLAEIYESEEAERYRRGTLACDDCSIRPVCGGCLAVSYSLGLDMYRQRDPFCFMRPSGP